MKNLLLGLLLATSGLPVLIGFTIPFIAEQSPVEAKVVELHMRTKSAEIQEQKKRKGDVTTLPFRGGTCSGSFIDATGDVLTARHCVDGFDSFEVQTYDGRIYAAVVIATSAAHDLAMIHIDRMNTPFFRLASDVTRGQHIFILGSPLGITNTLSEGVVAKLDGDMTLLDCSALPGNSGGPVFDQYQRMIGVLNAGYIVMYGVTHLNQAQGLDAVHFFLKEALEKRYGR